MVKKFAITLGVGKQNGAYNSDVLSRLQITHSTMFLQINISGKEAKIVRKQVTTGMMSSWNAILRQIL